MSKPDAPAPPDPKATSQAATGTNVGTAISNAMMNNMTQITPDGTQSYDVTGNYAWTDPYTNQTYNIPKFTQTQTLSPEQTAIKGQNDATKLNLATMGNQQSGALGSYLSNPFALSGNTPAAGDPNAVNNVPDPSTTFGDAGQMTMSYGPTDNFSADRQRVQDSLMARINPQLDIQQDKLRQQLQDQGIRYGSEAYNNAFTPMNQQRNDAQFAAISQAGQEQQRMMDMAAQKAGFENAAQQQQYTQQQGRGTFANASLAQQLAQKQAGFTASNAARSQSVQEQFATRNQPINEITALMSGSQVSQPQFGQTPTSQIPTTDVAGLINNQFSQQFGNYQAANTNWQSLMGGILGLGGNAMKAYAMSDRREKENLHRVGTVFAASSVAEADHDEKKLPIYSYNFKRDPAKTRQVGPMAQDVEKAVPGAVKNFGGIKYVDEDVMGSILRAA